MDSIKILVPASILKAAFKAIVRISPLILLILNACSPAAVPAVPVEVLATPTLEASQPPTVSPEEITQPPTAVPAETTQSPSATPEKTISPYYLPLATQPDVAPQTIEGVTAQIDWAYVDESRVALHYTISGLDWATGTAWDAMSVRISSPAVSNTDIGFGGGGWTGTPVKDGVISGSSDQLFIDGMLDAAKHPNIDLKVEIPVEKTTFRFEFNVPVLDGLKVEDLDQTVVANDISMTLKTLVLNPSRAEALICFQMPSAVDWGLTASTFTVGDKEYHFSGGGVLPGTDGKNFRLTDPDRCITVGFDIGDDKSATSVSLTVPKLMSSVPEVVDKDRVEAANQRLAGTGIEFDYANLDHGGNIEILKRPEGATDQEIYPLIWDALADQYDGPWVFTVAIPR